MAQAAAAAREFTPRRVRMLATCRWTVCTLSTSCSAISASVQPFATSRRTSSSRSDRAAPRSAGGSVRRRLGVAAGQEEVDGLGERGGVTAPREVVLAGQLEEAGAGHPLGEVATERERDGAVAATVQHQRRAADGGEPVGDVQLVDGPQRLGRQVAGRGPTLELRERLPLARVGAGQEDVGEHPRAQAPVRLHERDHLLAGGRGGDVGSAGVAAVQHEPVGAVRVVRGVRRRDRAAGRRTQEVDPLGADGVDHAREHGDLGVPVRRRWAGAVGEPGCPGGRSGPPWSARRAGRRSAGTPASSQSSSRWLDHQPPITRTGPEPTEDQATDRPPMAAWWMTWSSSSIVRV